MLAFEIIIAIVAAIGIFYIGGCCVAAVVTYAFHDSWEPVDWKDAARIIFGWPVIIGVLAWIRLRDRMRG